MKYKLRLSHSAMDKFLTCPKKYYFSNVAGIEPVDQTKFTFGRVMHKFLEVYWDKNTEFTTRLADGLAALQKSAKKNKLSIEEEIVAQVLACGYHARWEHTQAHGETEVRRIVPVVGTDGQIDEQLELKAIFDQELPEPHILYEHKTTRTADISVNSRYMDRVRRSTQLDIYFIVADDSGSPLNCILWDVIRIPKMQRRRATPPSQREFYKRDGKYGKKGDPKPGTFLADETLEEFRDRVYREVATDPEAYFQVKQMFPNKRAQEVTRYDIWSTGQLMLEAHKNNAFPRNRNSCNLFNQKCEYYPVCFESVDPKRSELYVIRNRPNPLRIVLDSDNSGDGTSD